VDQKAGEEKNSIVLPVASHFADRATPTRENRDNGKKQQQDGGGEGSTEGNHG